MTSPASTDPDRLVSYLGLNPRVRQSGNSPAVHGRITKAGPAQARGMLVEAAFSASRAPGPLRAFYRRVKDRRGFQVATVATARKMTVLCWHLITKGEDYAFARPSLNAHKRRKLELAAGAPVTPRARARSKPRLPHQTATRSGTSPRRTRRTRLRGDGRPLATPTTRRARVDNLIRRVDDRAELDRERRGTGRTRPRPARHVSIIAG